jgi:hypothetical protein
MDVRSIQCPQSSEFQEYQQHRWEHPGPFNLHGRSDRSPSELLGFTSAFEARKLQLGVRVSL